jgi:hypothetical protein
MFTRSPLEKMKSSTNLSFLDRDRVDNLLKAHI